MARDDYDVVIIGAGIHGAGVAQAAAAGGHAVLVLEQTGIASGTSSRSSKLIHGGLRYLETGQFSLVRECLRERALLLRLAPDLVQMRQFHIPIYGDTRRRPWQMRLGLSLYAVLAGRDSAAGFRSLPAREWSRLDGIETRGLERVFQYQDAQTDDLALTRAVMGSALDLGAQLLIPAVFTGAELTEQGSIVHYRHDGVAGECRASILVNAAGPWVNEVIANITPRTTGRTIDLVQGAHIVIDGELTRGIYYLEAPRDGRAVFAMPWRGQLLLGTTEIPYSGNPAAVALLPQEQDYLLETFAHYFPAWHGGAGDRVVDSYAGLRVLPGNGTAAFRRPRDTVLHTDRPGNPRLLTIYGGKLTAYRATAEKVMRRLRASLPARKPIASTSELQLHAEDLSPGDPEAGC